MHCCEVTAGFRDHKSHQSSAAVLENGDAAGDLRVHYIFCGHKHKCSSESVVRPSSVPKGQ